MIFWMCRVDVQEMFPVSGMISFESVERRTWLYSRRLGVQIIALLKCRRINRKAATVRAMLAARAQQACGVLGVWALCWTWLFPTMPGSGDGWRPQWPCVGVVRRRHRRLLLRLAVAAADAVEVDLRRLAHAVAVATVLRCLALVSCDDTVKVAVSLASRSRNREGSVCGDCGISRIICSGVGRLGDSGHSMPPVRSNGMWQIFPENNEHWRCRV